MLKTPWKVDFHLRCFKNLLFVPSLFQTLTAQCTKLRLSSNPFHVVLITAERWQSNRSVNVRSLTERESQHISGFVVI